MNKHDYLDIGTTIKTHGIHGEVIISAKIPDLLADVSESVLLEIDGLLVPFFIDKIHATSKERFRVKFDWVDSEPQARKITNCQVFVPTKSIDHSKVDFEENYDILTDFTVVDKKHGEIGVVEYILDSNDNPLMAVKYNNNEILIPIHHDIVLDVDTENKIISIDSPEGLIDLYLE